MTKRVTIDPAVPVAVHTNRHDAGQTDGADRADGANEVPAVIVTALP